MANHGVSQELVTRQFEASKRFFELPLEAKIALRVGSSTHPRMSASLD